jgi:hypothetical protein
MARPVCLLLTLVSSLALLALLPAGEERKDDTLISWKKTVLDKKFRAEGVAVGDVNRDGKLDILTRQGWYEAPSWKYHEISEPKDYGDGSGGYSNCFACWTEDINKDGWPDLIVIDFPGEPCYWLENPKGSETHWKKHIIWHSACNETPLYADLLGKGQRVLVMGWQPKGKQNEGQMAYFTPGKDPTQLWEMHPISAPSTPSTYTVTTNTLEALKKEKVAEELVKSLEQLQNKTFATPQELLESAGKVIPDKAECKKELDAIKGKLEQHAQVRGQEIPGTFKFSHGLGVGDVNGDGRSDVITTGGWWEQPAELKDTPWKFHPANLGGGAADMYAYDMDGDGKADIISSSPHGYGIWWFQQKADSSGKVSFQQRDLFPKLFSQTHAMHFVDVNGDGLKDLVTGKRFWAHGPRGDADPNAPAVLYWFEARKSKEGVTSFLPHKIDDDSGIGTQFAVADVNGDGLPDIVTANKKGVFLFEQIRAKK